MTSASTYSFLKGIRGVQKRLDTSQNLKNQITKNKNEIIKKLNSIGYEDATELQAEHLWKLGIDVTKLIDKENAPKAQLDFQESDNYKPLIYMGILNDPDAEKKLELYEDQKNVFMKKDGWFILNYVGASLIPGTYHYNCKIQFEKNHYGARKKKESIYYFTINTNQSDWTWGGKKSSKTKKPVKKPVKKPTTKKPVKKTTTKKPTTKKPVKKTTTKKPTTKKPVKKTTTKKPTTKKPVKKTTTKKPTTKKPVKKTTTKK